MALKENYKDDILDTSQNVKRKYQMENNGDGTVSFTDVTEYTQQGDSFGASDMNATNGAVNEHENDLTLYDVDNEEYTTDKFRFAKKGDEFGYLDENDNFVAFGGGETVQFIGTYTGNQTIDVTQYIKSGDTVENFIIEFMGNDAIQVANPRSDAYSASKLDTFTPLKSLSGNNLSITMTASNSLQALGKSNSGDPYGVRSSVSVSYKYNLYYRKM